MDFDKTHGGSEEEKVRRELTQDLIDRMCYLPDFIDKCRELIKNNPLPSKIRIKHNPLEFTNHE